MTLDVIVAGGIFLVAYALIALERWDRTLVALLGGFAVVVLGLVDQHQAFEAIDLNATDLLFIENVGNLVCPAAWDLGEDAKIVLFSVTEGEDKPSKYPKMFQMATWAVFTKMDLLSHVPFSLDRAVSFARAVNPDLQFLMTSSLRRDGLGEWYGFLRSRIARRGVAFA